MVCLYLFYIYNTFIGLNFIFYRLRLNLTDLDFELQLLFNFYRKFVH